MVIVDQLLGRRGDARHILSIPEDGIANLSDRSDMTRLEVLRGITFRNFSVTNVEVGLNFVACGFEHCTFRHVRTEGHLWGAEDVWSECRFDHCDLNRMIAPMNSFFRCCFEDVSLVNFQPYQTLFDGCSFVRWRLEGLKAQMISNRTMKNPHLAESSGVLHFRNCRFESVAFLQCYFEGAVFEQCSFDDVSALSCAFDGVTSDIRWWLAQKEDPFAAFLTKALELIAGKCGKDSSAYREFENYVIDFRCGRTSSKDFSACLYTNCVPYVETQKIIKDLRKLVAASPF